MSSVPRVMLDPVELADLELIVSGAAAPLTGFLGRADYASVLADGTPWPVPAVLAVEERQRAAIDAAGAVEVFDRKACSRGIVRVSELYRRDPIGEARAIFGTDDAHHPGVARILARPRLLVGGTIEAEPAPATLATPRGLRAAFDARGWRTVASIEPGEVPLRVHEDAILEALERVDGVVIHARTALGLITANALAGVLPAQRALVAPLPARPLLAGPREVRLRALLQTNLGIQTSIEEPAGAGDLSAARARTAIRAGRALPRALVRDEVAAILRAHWLADVQEAVA